MKENERKDYERLRAEGRWLEANEFREVERKRLRADGRNRQQACDESWSAMLAKYPPIEPNDPATEFVPTATEGSLTPPRIAEIERAPDFEFLLRWAVANMGLEPEKLDVSQVPNPACIEMLRFAKQDPAKFFGWLAKYDEKAQEQSKAAQAFQDDKRKHFKLFELLLEEYEARLRRENALASSSV
ncbi:MAG: hypothetical protein NT013_11295 [Planctomycetia bacterium]|nr:hypothetical protein [Planctomycetia bacterium]